MTIEEELYEALKPYCIQLGWIKFDIITESNKEITAKSELTDWKVLSHEKESATRYLENSFPNVDKSVILKVINNNLKHDS